MRNTGCLVPPPVENYTSNLIVRKVKVNRNRTPQEALDATGFTQLTSRKVVDSMPKGDGDEVKIVFFKPDLSESNGRISDDDLEKEFERRGLKPADPISVAAVNEDDPTFVKKKPHGTHFKDANGEWCFVTFHHRLKNDECRMNVYHNNGDWDDHWWFAGICK